MGAAGIAAWVALAAFWVLIVVGRDELGPKGIVLFVVLFFAGFLGRGFVPYGASLFTSYLALLDIVLVLLVFKGDVTLR
jgi:hypothetical protein